MMALTNSANGMTVPGATEAGVINDCQVTAEISVMLLKNKAKIAPEQLVKAATKILVEKKYNGSFGDTAFVANFYTGMALQMGTEVDPAMAAATPDELESMTAEHESDCLQKALAELQPVSDQPSPAK